MMDFLGYLSLPVTLLAIFCIQAMSLQLILGGAGLLSLGHAAYLAVGGYAAGAVTVFGLPALGIDPTQYPLTSLFIAMVGGMVAAGVTGFLVALPCLRLQGDYLAMATLGFGEIVVTVLKNVEVLGGTRGFKDIPRLVNPGVLWISVALVGAFLYRLYRSPLGLAILATRDDEIAARSLGISTSNAKVSAFVIGTALAGLAGAFHVHTLQFISPDAADFTRSVEVLLAVVLGGMFSLPGSIFGAIILVFVPELLRFAPAWVAEKRMLFFSLVVIIIMVRNPAGLTAFVNSFLLRFGRKRGTPTPSGGP